MSKSNNKSITEAIKIWITMAFSLILDLRNGMLSVVDQSGINCSLNLQAQMPLSYKFNIFLLFVYM